MAQAELMFADGSGISAEATNQRFAGVPSSGLTPKDMQPAPVVSAEPPLRTTQLVHLVEALASRS